MRELTVAHHHWAAAIDLPALHVAYICAIALAHGSTVEFDLRFSRVDAVVVTDMESPLADYVLLPRGRWLHGGSVVLPLAHTRLRVAVGGASVDREMGELDKHGRPKPPLGADEEATLVGFLEWQRATFVWKCAGVDAAGLTATVGASSMTLGGLLKHQARSEDYWFSHQLLGRDIGVPWDSLDWGSDWKWHSMGDTLQDLWALWEQNVERSRAALEQVLRSDGLGGVVRRPPPNVEPASARWVLCHMIEEYARHNGHADLLREFVDGQTGE